MQSYRVIGIESSPYAVKVRAVMRYRRIAHHWVARMPQFYDETKNIRPPSIPVVQFPSGEYRTDSTPIILVLEKHQPLVRSVLPRAPEVAFLAALLEDMADEWLLAAHRNKLIGVRDASTVSVMIRGCVLK